MPANRYYLILVLLLMMCNACIEPFEPVINEAQEVMVIDGMISDRPGSHRVNVFV